jgi:putative MFS transporter
MRTATNVTPSELSRTACELAADDPASIDVHARNIVARMDRLPATRAIWKIVVLLALGGAFEYYDLFMTGYIAPGLVASGILAKTSASFFAWDTVSAFVAATFLGFFIGTIGLGFLADRFGRRRIFVVALLGYTAATIAMAFQDTALGVNFFRLLTGIGLGVEMVTIHSYVAELVPKEMRGRAFIVTQVIPSCAVPMVALMSWWLLPLQPFGIDGWRWVVFASAAGAVVVWVIRLGIPESPRWLVMHGHVDAAEKLMRKLEKQVEREYGKPLPAPAVSSQQVHAERHFTDIIKPPYLKRTIMMSLFNIVGSIGYYGFNNWVPQLLSSKGFSLVHSLQYSFFMAIAIPIGPCIYFYFADRVERKWTLVGSLLAIAVFGMAFAYQSQPVGVVTLGLLLNLSQAIMGFSFLAYQAELYPTEIRSRAIGFVYSWSRLSAVFSGFLVAFFLGKFGITGVFTLISGCMVLGMLLVGVMGPRTSGRALEDISH